MVGQGGGVDTGRKESGLKPLLKEAQVTSSRIRVAKAGHTQTLVPVVGKQKATPGGAGWLGAHATSRTGSEGAAFPTRTPSAVKQAGRQRFPCVQKTKEKPQARLASRSRLSHMPSER